MNWFDGNNRVFMASRLVRAQRAYKDIRICSIHHTHARMVMHAYTCAHTCTHVHTHTCTHACTRVHAHTHTHTHTHTLTLTHTNTLTTNTCITGDGLVQ